MKPRLRGGGTVGAKPKLVAAAVLKNCTCASQGCASETVWDAISQRFVAGRLVGLKEFDSHKLEDDRLRLASKLPPPSESTSTTGLPSSKNQSAPNGQHSPTARSARSASLDAPTSKSAQRQQRRICKGFNTLLDLQHKLQASETYWDRVLSTLDDLVFVHSPALHNDSPVPDKRTKDTPHTLNEGPHALLYDNPSNAPLIQYEEELLQLLHICDGIVDYGDKELQDAKSAWEGEVDHKFREIEEMKAKAWQVQKRTGGSTGTTVNAIETGKGRIGWFKSWPQVILRQISPTSMEEPESHCHLMLLLDRCPSFPMRNLTVPLPVYFVLHQAPVGAVICIACHYIQHPY
jgi:hypothetical protein